MIFCLETAFARLSNSFGTLSVSFCTIEDSVVKVSLTLCYGLNAMSPNSCVEALPTPPTNVTVFGDESCGGDKGKMMSWGGALICRAGALMRGGRDTCAVSLPGEDTGLTYIYMSAVIFWENVI